ncbi:hypothetical protein [Hymenobacter coccineus]|uniref:Uncharacterized protein n=1 Tax=Hymenobacter coccineus TaxID=1908235 RepID=A0A1G1TDR6_9BACT|nr:hypothetical protein [Hymenobacter coccineus]OGX89001.1 hypothetical protein BEN49_01325 [Hymenobacter coccineus]
MSPNTPDANQQEQPEENGLSTPMLDAATYGQQLDNDNLSGQEKSDEMDDSLSNYQQEMAISDRINGEFVSSDPDELPKELTDPSDRAFTLPEEQTPR